MSAREDILGRVREALRDAPPSPTVDRGYRSATPVGAADLAGQFAERVADYRADVVRCSAAEVESRIAALVGRSAVVVPQGLPWRVEGSVEDTGQSADELDRIDAVVTGATVGIALTGTIVLDHGPGQGRRALSLVPDTHICVVKESHLVHGIPEAVALLDSRRPQTWISGPSATSDIELNRVEGVHGPRNLHVILVG
jgi:L-lactate dehydrogenase complex protein LldG